MRPSASQRAIDLVLELATRLPWWGGVLSAVAVYAILHPIAGLHMPTPDARVDVAVTAVSQLLVLLAEIGQYLLPLTFLATAVISGFAHWRRTTLRASVAQDATGSVLRSLPWEDFVLIVGDAFQRRGFEVKVGHVGSSARGGVLEMIHGGRCFLVDCADWRSGKASATAVRGLHTRIKEVGAAGGFAVTSGQFTSEAKRFAAEEDIELIDGRRLKGLIRAEQPPVEYEALSVLAHLRSKVSRWWDLVQRIGDAPATRTMAAWEKRTREPAVRPWARQTPIARGLSAQVPAEQSPLSIDDAEIAAANRLTALIRDDHRIEEAITLSAPRVQRYRAGPRRRRAWPKLQAHQIADGVGILIAAGILWGLHAWFMRLPAEPTHTTWTLLGAHHDLDDALARQLRGLSRPRSAAQILQGQPPLGQLLFGPPPGFLTLAPAPIPAPPEPVVVYHSLRELENAFNAKYVPPPECYAYESNNLMIKCGNHRIRARRKFIETGGKVTPMLLGSWEEPPAVQPTAYGQGWPQQETRGWRQDNGQEAWQEWGGDYTPEADRTLPTQHLLDPLRSQPLDEPAGYAPWDTPRRYEEERGHDWRETPSLQPDGDRQQDWRQEWIHRPAPDPAQDWRQNGARDGEEDWSRDWTSKPLPVERRHWVDDL